jgi:hypothetical protein
MDLILLLYKYRDEIDKAFNGEEIEELPKELYKDVPIFQKPDKKFELSVSYLQFANSMLERIDANYRFGDYNEEIKLLIQLKESYLESKEKELLSRMKKLARTLYKKIEERDRHISARINDIVSDNDLNIELIIKDAQDIDNRITELISAHSDNLEVLSEYLRGVDEELDEVLIDIGLNLIPLTQNIHLYNDKLSDFILRTEKRKRENKQLMAIANKIIKEQDHELKSLLLSHHELYHHTVKEKKSGMVKHYPAEFELKKDSFLELLVSALQIERVQKKAPTTKPYTKPQDTVLKAVNIKKIEQDIAKEKPQNLFEYLLSHPEIKKFQPQNQEKIFAFKVYLTIVQNFRENIRLQSKYASNIKVAQWI